MTMTDPQPSALAGNAESTGMRSAGIAALVLLFALICFLPLPTGAPLAGTEGHRAMTAHQMVESGEWVVPRLFGRIYIAKPPLHYWIIGMFEKLSGRATPFIWRLPSAVEGAITAALLSLFAGRWFGRIAGWVSGVSFVALIALWGENRGADIDVTNTLAANLAAMCLLDLHFRLGCHRWLRILIAGLAIGASLLVKGPAGLTIILGTMAWLVIVAVSKREYASLRRPRFWLPLVLGSALLAMCCGKAAEAGTAPPRPCSGGTVAVRRRWNCVTPAVSSGWRSARLTAMSTHWRFNAR